MEPDLHQAIKCVVAWHQGKYNTYRKHASSIKLEDAVKILERSLHQESKLESVFGELSEEPDNFDASGLGNLMEEKYGNT